VSLRTQALTQLERKVTRLAREYRLASRDGAMMDVLLVYRTLESAMRDLRRIRGPLPREED
jgi:hypothetical protein